MRRDTKWKYIIENNKPIIRKSTPKIDIHIQNKQENNNIDEEINEDALHLLAKEPFDSNNEEDARIKVQAMLALRKGQPKFRAQLIKLYNGKCVISGCNIVQVLEAAHILPYLGEKSNHICNGLLLRGDIHTLFDLDLISIDSDTFEIKIDESLSDSIYWEFCNKKINIPIEIAQDVSDVLKKKQHTNAFIF